MNDVPLTFLMPCIEDEKTRKVLWSECAANGIENIVLGDWFISAIKFDPAMAKVYQDELSNAGLKFVDSHAPFGAAVDMNNFDSSGLLALNHTLHLHIAALMGVKSITIHAGNDSSLPGLSVAQQQDNISRMLDKLLPEAEKLDVAIAIENIWLPVSTPENLWVIKKRFPTPYLGFCYDAGHANLMSRTNGSIQTNSAARTYWEKCSAGVPAWDDEILEKMLPELINCHLHDNMGDIDDHNLPGNGTIDWQKTIALLKKAPRIKAIQSEVIIERNSISVKALAGKFKELFG